MARRISTFSCRFNANNQRSYPTTSGEETQQILALAHEVHVNGTWQIPELRKKFFVNLTLALKESEQALKQVYCAESSLSEERFEREFRRMLVQISAYSKEGFLLSKKRIRKVLSERTLERLWTPIGPVLVFGASNFPLAYGTLGGDTIGAMAAGCPVIVKGHPLHAGTSILLASIAAQSLESLKLPQGIFGHILGEGYGIGSQLIQDERIHAGVFTGSLEGGMSLFRLAQQRKSPIPFFAEMGSLNPIIMMRNISNREEVMDQLTLAVTEDAGQFCTKPGILLVPNDQLKEMLKMLHEKMQKRSSFPMLHPSIFINYNARLQAIEACFPVIRFSNQVAWNADRAYVHCSIEQFLKTPVLQQEVFGPFICLVGYSETEEIKPLLTCIGGQLTITFFGNNPEKEVLWKIAKNCSGRIVVNGVPTGVSVERSMNHGGPFPASTDARFTSVGEASILRFFRPVSVQRG